MPTAAATSDYAPPARACPACGAECKRHSVYTRRVKDVSLDGPVVLAIPIGNYFCPECRRFHKPELPFAGKGKRYTTRAVRKATVSVQEDKTTYTALPNRLNRDFTIRPAKSTGWSWFQEFAGNLDIESYLRWACARFSGQLSVDSVVDGDMQMWFATDPLNHDLILGYHRAENANAETLTAFLTRLRDGYGIAPHLIVTDDAIVFDNTPRRVWPAVPLQLCHFHVIKAAIYGHLRHSLASRIRGLRPYKPPKGQRPDGKPLPKHSRGYMSTEYAYAFAKWQEDQRQWTELHRRRRLFFKSARALAEPGSRERHEAEYLDECCARYLSLRKFRQFVLDFYAIMDSRDAAAAELLRRAFIAQWIAHARLDDDLAHVLKSFGNDKWFARLFPFTAFANASRTTNSTERANRWFRKRQKSHYRLRKEHTIRNMLHADLILRRDRTPPGEPPVRLIERSPEIRSSA